MNLDLKQACGPSGVFVEIWVQTLERFVLKNIKVGF